jgi:hypothetical protein
MGFNSAFKGLISKLSGFHSNLTEGTSILGCDVSSDGLFMAF